MKSASTPITGSIGTGFITPPSTSSRPLTMIGVTTPGIATDARIATSTGPEVNHTSRCAPTSAATAVNGIGNSSIRAPSSISLTRPITRSSLSRPGPGRTGSRSRRTSRCDSVSTQSAYSSSLPAAYSPPITAPMDVPATATTS